MKKLFSILLCLAVLISSVVSIGAVADTKTVGGSCGENLNWSYDSSNSTVTISGSGEMTDFIDYAPWWSNDINVEKAVVEEGVTSLGENSFKDLMGLSEISLPSTLSSIGDSAFSGCESLRDIVIPENVKVIGSHSFFLCYSLREVVLPKSVSKIEVSAFSECGNLSKVTFYNDNCVIEEGSNTIYSGATIYGGANSTAQAYAQKYNRTFIAIETEPAKPKGECGENASWEYDEATATLTISGSGDMADYNYEDNPAPWSDYPVEKAIIEENITSVGDSAFADLELLAEITIPQTVTKIGVYSFSECDKLEEIVLPDTLTTLSELSFSGCRGLESFTIPSCVTSLPPYVFGGCQGLKSVYIHKDITDIHKNAFQGCVEVKSIVVDPENPVYDSRDNCNSIILTENNSLYLGCNGTTIPKTVTAIDEDAFDMGFGPKRLTIPGNVKTIGKYAFLGTQIEKLTIEEGVEVIEEYAFAATNKPQKLILPKSIKYIGQGAFSSSFIEEIVILNPECEIFDKRDTLLEGWVCKIYGFENSTAQAYAEKYNRNFVVYVEPDYIIGDADMDGVLSVLDATEIQMYKAEFFILSEKQMKAADFDGDGEVSVMDATAIQFELANL